VRRCNSEQFKYVFRNGITVWQPGFKPVLPDRCLFLKARIPIYIQRGVMVGGFE
jgi:hypothetical protein